jgi:hypothetical protein
MFLLFLKAPTFKEQRVGLFKNDLIYPFRRYSSEDGRSKFPSIVQALVMVTGSSHGDRRKVPAFARDW